MPRPSKPHRTSWNEEIHGLHFNKKNRRWRVLATGEKFREPDERRAVDRFLAIMEKVKPATVLLPIDRPSGSRSEPVAPLLPETHINGAVADPVSVQVVDEALADPNAPSSPGIEIEAGHRVDERRLWRFFRDVLVNDPARAAKMTGLPELAGWRHLNTPKEPAKLADLLKVYLANTDAAKKQKDKVAASWAMFITHTEAATTDDVSEEKILAFRDWLKRNPKYEAKSKQLIAQRVKAVVNSAVRNGYAERASVLAARLKALQMPDVIDDSEPSPISPEAFRTILNHKSTDAKMKCAMLLGLNTCSYLAEIIRIKWKELDLERKTYVGRRTKNKNIRAAVLWPETIDALKRLPRRGEYVLLSQRGTKYHVEAIRKNYKAHRERCGYVEEDPSVEFAALRDAAYTVSSGKVLLQQTHVLAGHSNPGQTDRYIKRNPEYVADACRVVREHFLPF